MTPIKSRPVVIKLGGELTEEPRRLRAIGRAIVKSSRRRPTVVVHGGGREIDAEMKRLGLRKQAVDGLRITDAETLDVVLGVLAGRVNTRVVATIGALGGSAVGLTGVDAGITRVHRARRYRAADGSSVDLGFVGIPRGHDSPMVIPHLTRAGHIPVIASLGADAKGVVYNVNADTLASDLACRVGADQLVIAGSTAGVLDTMGRTIREVDDDALSGLVRDGTATAGMIAKLLACRAARAGGVRRVLIADGTDRQFLEPRHTRGVTTITARGSARRSPPHTHRLRGGKAHDR